MTVIFLYELFFRGTEERSQRCLKCHRFRIESSFLVLVTCTLVYTLDCECEVVTVVDVAFLGVVTLLRIVVRKNQGC